MPTSPPHSGKRPLSEDQYVALCTEARAASGQAYAPYSHFRVGAAVLAADDSIHVGANVENASFGATVCAERVALGAAIVRGLRTGIQAIALHADSADRAWDASQLVPCGICLQWLAEIAPEAEIVVCRGDRWSTFSVGQLITTPFVQSHEAEKPPS